MKASELEIGKTYGTVWGCELEFIGTEEVSAYYEEFDETRSSTMYVFVDQGGRTYMHADEVEKFVSNDTVEIRTDLLAEIMKGVDERQAVIDKALRKVAKLTKAIEDMKYDCDGEVYEELWKIQDVLAQ